MATTYLTPLMVLTCSELVEAWFSADPALTQVSYSNEMSERLAADGVMCVPRMHDGARMEFFWEAEDHSIPVYLYIVDSSKLYAVHRTHCEFCGAELPDKGEHDCITE